MDLQQFSGLTKLAAHSGWLAAYRRGEAVAPLCVEMDLTNRCNYSCPNCVWGEFITGDRAHLCRDQALAQVRQCAEAGVKAIIFSGGGEPLLHANAIEAISLARHLGLDVGLFTNAVPITEASAAVLARACRWVRVHLDATTVELYRSRHGIGPSGLERVKQNLLRLNEADTGVEVGIGSVVNRDTVGEMESLARLCLLTSCRYWQAKHDFDLLPDPAYRAWWDEQVVPQLRDLEARYACDGFAIQYTVVDYSRQPTARRCHVHHLTTAINARSEYSYCKRLRDRPEWSAGNLRQTPLRAILAGPLNLRLSEEITPRTCGVVCPYLDLNELLDAAVTWRQDLPAAAGPGPHHANFF